MTILLPGIAETFVAAGRSLIGIQYDYEASSHDAPGKFNCQTFIWWVYARHGIQVPHLLSEQVQLGIFMPYLHDIKAGDWVLSRGPASRYVFHDPERAQKGVGHIGLATGVGTILHASSRTRAVVEEPLLAFLGGKPHRFRGAVRLFAR